MAGFMCPVDVLISSSIIPCPHIISDIIHHRFITKEFPSLNQSNDILPIRVSELDLGERCTTARVMNYLLYNTTNIAVPFCVIQRS